MLNEWAQTKKAPKHAQWVHDGTEPPDVRLIGFDKNNQEFL